MRKNTNKKIGISRTMDWLLLSPKIQANFRKNFLNIDVDYLQYTCYDIKHPLKLLYSLLGFSGEIDNDNSNIEFSKDYNLSLELRDTRMGRAYAIDFLSPGFKPVPIISVEVYSTSNKRVLKTEGKIVFYGAYFVFRDIIAEDAPEVIRFANMIELGTITQYDQKEKHSIYKRTRVDIACDIALPVSQKWMTDYIRPHKNSKHVIKPYNYQPDLGGFQSFNYIPKITQCIGIRIYNKMLDIHTKTKEAWYPEYGTEKNPQVTRLEIVFAGDSATDTIENLIKYAKFRLLGDESVKIRRKNRPKSTYSAQSAYQYFKRYARNNGVTIEELIHDVNLMMEQEQNKDKEFSI